MKFYCIATADQKTTISLLRKASQDRKIDFILLDPTLNFDVSLLENDESRNILYRVSDGKRSNALTIENALLERNVVSFYKHFPVTLNRSTDYDSTTLEEYGVATPKSVKDIETDGIMRKIGTLGDFPVIVKVMGGSHGVGVIRVDSEESLRSLSDYLFATKVTFVVKEYFTVRSSLRLVVVGNTVVDAIQYMVPVGDFRSNVGEFPVVVKVVPSKVSISLALRAVASLGLDFGGVDILVTDKRNYITEVNFPCFFPRCQLLTGTDIAGMMIDFLIEKSKKLLQ